MDRSLKRLETWWAGLGAAGRQDVSILLLASWGYLVHYVSYCLLQPFFIEDAGISFAFARNLVEGHGLVPIVGGERVEGFSNPLWTFLIAGLYAVGVPVWASAKLMGGILGVAMLPMVTALIRRAAPSEGPWWRRASLVAPFLLAGSPQFVVWNAAGLENSLFTMLVLLGLLLVAREAEDDRFPWSAIVFLLLTATRPEGVMYACVGFVGRAIGDLRRARVGRLLLWVVLLGAPWLAFNAWRYWYFAWPFPNTYYAKLGVGDRFDPFAFEKKGWLYVTGFFWKYGLVFSLPIVAVGLAGVRWWRVIVVVFALLVPVVAWKGDVNAIWQSLRTVVPIDLSPDRIVLSGALLSLRDHWGMVKVTAIVGSAVALGLATLTRPGWSVRGLLWLTFSASLFFVVYTGGDWMDGYRWFNVVVPTYFAVLCLGVAELAALDGAVILRGRRIPVVRAALALGLLAIVAVGIVRSNALAISPETAVRDVHRRVEHMRWVAERLDVDKVKLLDVDMGAHMYFTDWDIVDMAGLIDVPIARHPHYDPRFMREYLYEEEVPNFAHVHGSWGKVTKVITHPEFKRDYLEIEGYRIGGRSVHPGAYIRKDLFISTHDGETAPLRRYDNGLDLLAFEVTTPSVPAGDRLHVTTRWHENRRRVDFRVLVAVRSGGRTIWSALPPGYDWYPPKDWKPTDEVLTHHWIDLPADFPEGPATIGLVVLAGATGLPVPVLDQEAETAPLGEMPEMFWSDIELAIVPRLEAEHLRQVGLGEAIVLSETDRCEDVWPRFKAAGRHLARDEAWVQSFQDHVRTLEARCYLRRADLAPPLARIPAMESAVQAHYDATRSRAVPFAQALDREADAVATTSPEAAYRLYLAAIRIDPTLSWTRRKLEAVRDERLGIERDMPEEGATEEVEDLRAGE